MVKLGETSNHAGSKKVIWWHYVVSQITENRRGILDRGAFYSKRQRNVAAAKAAMEHGGPLLCFLSPSAPWLLA